MFFIKSEYPINEKVDDVLAWLENDMQIIEAYDSDKIRVTYHVKRNGNAIEVFHKVRENDQKPSLRESLSFSFEVKRVTDTKSLIAGKYQDENIHIEKLYYFYLARLGGMFQANFKETAMQRLGEIKSQIEKESGGHMGWTEWRTDDAGRKVRAYGFIPNDPEPKNQPVPIDLVRPDNTLTLRQVDNVVQSTLFGIEDWEHERQEQGATILYTVWSNVTSKRLYLGVFRVWEWLDGSGRCGWNPLAETSPEHEKLRHFFHMEMVMPILIEANNKIIDRSQEQTETAEYFNPTAFLAREILRQSDIESEKKHLEELRKLYQDRIALERSDTAQVNTSQVVEPPKPPKPKKQGGKINVWLDWYHAMNDNGYKCTLEDVASGSGYSLGYIKQKHMVYQAKPNQKPNRKPNQNT